MHEDFTRSQQVKSSSNRAFGWMFVIVFLIIALWPLLFGGALRWWSLIISTLVMLITQTAPGLLTIPNRLWMRFGMLLHRVVSPVIAVMFFLIVTPTGLLMRVFAKRPLRLGRDPAAASYWIKRDPPGPPAEDMSNQF